METCHVPAWKLLWACGLGAFHKASFVVHRCHGWTISRNCLTQNFLALSAQRVLNKREWRYPPNASAISYWRWVLGASECCSGQGSASSSSAISLGRRTWTLIGDSLWSCHQIKCIQNWLDRFARLMPLSIDVNCTYSIEGKPAMYMSHNNYVGTALAVNKTSDSTEACCRCKWLLASRSLDLRNRQTDLTWFNMSLLWKVLQRPFELWSAGKGNCPLQAHGLPLKVCMVCMVHLQLFHRQLIHPLLNPFLALARALLIQPKTSMYLTKAGRLSSKDPKNSHFPTRLDVQNNELVGSCTFFAYYPSNAVLAWAHNRAKAGWQHCPTFLLPYLQISVDNQVRY